jgi:hypothetical protein
VGITSCRFFYAPRLICINITNNIMNELVDRLTNEAGLTAEQSKKAIETIANFVKEKFPMLGGAVDNIFSAEGNSNED